MTSRVLIVLTLAAIALAAPGGAVAATKKAHSGLWATVNLCDTKARPGAVGIRVSIPREKGAPAQWAHIRLQWFDGKRRAWRRVTSGGDAGWARIGIGTRQVQGGTTFTFPPPKPGSRIVLRGIVEVQWRDGTKVVDLAHLRTTAGHKDAKDPHRKVSRASCEIMR
ncbi:MAG TPA: hypothetical protein VH834_17765 [Solirubrobacteraceae bacterium]|jgi:hypothetical protein